MTINYQFGDVDAHGAMIRAQAASLEAEHQAIVRDVLAAGDFWGGAGSVACQEFITQLGRNFQVIYEQANAHGQKVQAAGNNMAQTDSAVGVADVADGNHRRIRVWKTWGFRRPFSVRPSEFYFCMEWLDFADGHKFGIVGLIDQEGADTFLPKLAELFEFVGTCAAADGFGHNVAHLRREGLERGVEADGNGFAGIAARSASVPLISPAPKDNKWRRAKCG